MLPLNQFYAFKLLLVVLCYQRGMKLDGLQEGFTFPSFKGTKCRFLSTAHYAVTCKSHACVDLNLHADSHSHRDLLLSRPILLLLFFSFLLDGNKNIYVFLCSARKWCKERGSVLNLLQCYGKRSVGRIYWPASVITLTESLLVALLSLGSIYKCHSASNPTVSPLSSEKALAIFWLGLITYCSNEE